MTARRLSKEELERLRTILRSGPHPARHLDALDGHIEALEAELRSAANLTDMAMAAGDRLRAENARLRETLERIAVIECMRDHDSEDVPCPRRLARAALRGEEDGGRSLASPTKEGGDRGA